MSSNIHYWAAFQKAGIGYRTIRRLLPHFGAVDTLWHSSRSDLTGTGASPSLVDAFVTATTEIDPAHYFGTITRHDTAIIDVEDERYPALLREIHSPPLVLFVRGNADIMARTSLAVVGTRKPTPYGIAATHRIAGPLASRGIVIVSGLAYGIDAEAHRAALDADGATLAVLGNGIDEIYPREHAQLAEIILHEGGALVSEFPPDAGIARHFFPQRNRVIAGLSRAALIVEAGLKSGALITARMGIDENREVFAVPGPIDQETSAGPNMLIKNGAGVATSAEDLFPPLGLDEAAPMPQNVEIIADSEHERVVLTLLGSPRHIDEVVAMSTLDVSVVNATLTLLEMKGRVRHLGGMHYIRTP